MLKCYVESKNYDYKDFVQHSLQAIIHRSKSFYCLLAPLSVLGIVRMRIRVTLNNNQGILSMTRIRTSKGFHKLSYECNEWFNPRWIQLNDRLRKKMRKFHVKSRRCYEMLCVKSQRFFSTMSLSTIKTNEKQAEELTSEWKNGSLMIFS